MGERQGVLMSLVLGFAGHVQDFKELAGLGVAIVTGRGEDAGCKVCDKLVTMVLKENFEMVGLGTFATAEMQCRRSLWHRECKVRAPTRVRACVQERVVHACVHSHVRSCCDGKYMLARSFDVAGCS